MNKHEAIMRVYPQAKIIIGDQAFDENQNPVMYDESVVQAFIASQAYKEQRAAEYPSIGDQLDALFRAGLFPAEMAEQIQAVKAKYPKA